MNSHNPISNQKDRSVFSMTFIKHLYFYEKKKSNRKTFMGLSNTKSIREEEDIHDTIYRINKLQDEIKFLTNLNKILENKIKNLEQESNQQTSSTLDGLTLTGLSRKDVIKKSEEKIRQYVEELLSNPSTNISWLPDSVERKIYCNFLNIIIKTLETIIESVNFDFLGHRINFVVDPVLDN